MRCVTGDHNNFQLRPAAANLFGQTDFGYDILIGPPKGSPTQLTLNTVYHIDKSQGNIPYNMYIKIAHKQPYARLVRNAVPICVGDSYKGLRIVGTTPKMLMFTVFVP